MYEKFFFWSAFGTRSAGSKSQWIQEMIIFKAVETYDLQNHSSGFFDYVFYQLRLVDRSFLWKNFSVYF